MPHNWISPNLAKCNSVVHCFAAKLDSPIASVAIANAGLIGTAVANLAQGAYQPPFFVQVDVKIPIKHFVKAAMAAVAVCTTASFLQAQTVTAVNGTPFNTTSIDESATGSSMAGMKVHSCFSSGCVDNVWSNIGGGYYGVENTLFRLRVGTNEDTYTGNWRFDLFTSTNLLSVTLSGASGNTLFDRTNPSTGSPGSSYGLDANLINQCTTASGGGLNCINFGPSNSATAEYSNRVSLNNVFYGDEYETVKFDFQNVKLTGPDASGGLDQDYTIDCPGGRNCGAVGFYLRMDTDNASLRTTVPEPATYGLMTLGLGVIGVAARRKRRSV